MGHVIFSKESYEYEGTRVFSSFYSDDRHGYLFDYVNKDLSNLPELFEQYISERIDTKTMNIKNLTSEDCKENDDHLNNIIEIIKTIHPYYEYEYKEIIINEIGKYFNNLLLFYSRSYGLVQEEWYDERILHLMPSLLMKNKVYSNNFYEKYMDLMGEKEYISSDNSGHAEIIKLETLIDLSEKKPMWFEIITQRTIYDMLYFILDVDVQELKDLTTHQRLWLYEKIHPFEQPIYVKKQLSYELSNCNTEATPEQSVDDTFSSLYTLHRSSIERTGIPVDKMKKFMLAVKYAKGIKASNIYEKYEVNSLSELLYLELMYMIQSGTKIRKCKFCGKYFVVNSHKTQYCNRITTSGKPCSIVGPKQSFKKKMEGDELWELYTKAYDTHYHRVGRGGRKHMTSEEFDTWREEARIRLDKVKSGKMSKDEFQAWLKE